MLSYDSNYCPLNERLKLTINKINYLNLGSQRKILLSIEWNETELDDALFTTCNR